MSFHTETHTITITGAPTGTGQATTNHKLRGMVHQILIFPTSGDPVTGTNWDYELLEQPSGIAVHGLDGQTGSANATFGVEIPMQSKFYVINFLNVDTDEDIVFRITVKEPAYGYGGGV